MLTVETKLARWRVFYGELCEAEQRLRQVQGTQTPNRGGATTAQLELKVRELQQRCNGALDEVGAALAARRSPQASKSGTAVAWHPA